MQYESILIKRSPKTIDEVRQFFWSEVSSDWSKQYAFNHYGHEYDKSHFIAHGFGGPVDVNLFPQRRDK